MMKKLLVSFLAISMAYLPLFSQKSHIVKKDRGCSNTKLTIKSINLGNGGNPENPIPPKNYERFFYDEAGRITKIISRDKGEIKFIYNEYGRLKSKIKSNIELQHYYYDKLGRNTKIEFKSNEMKDEVDFKYSTTEGSYKRGNMVEKIEENEHSFFKYSGSRLKEERKIIKGHEFVTEYDYNEKGLLSDIHYPSGLIVSYKYNNENRIENVFTTRNNIKTYALKCIREKNSTSFQYGNGLTTVFETNNEKKAIKLKTGDIQDMLFFFNKKGLIEKVIDKKKLKNKKEFYYDTRDRLITAYGPWGKISYRYDSMDNLKTKIEKNCKVEFSYYKKSSRIKELKENRKSIEVKYDKLGRMTKYGDISFKYNTRGRLERILKNKEVLVELFYNYKNQRVMEKRGDKEFYFIYDNQDRVLGEYDIQGNILKEYIYAKETPIGFIKNSKIYYYHYDLMNFPISISDESGRFAREVQHKPYGEVIHVKGNLDDSLRYPGQFEIGGTELYYNLNRIYNPLVGRYIVPDPAIKIGNLYQYAGCNPQKFVDIEGLKIREGKNCYYLDLYFREYNIPLPIINLYYYTRIIGENVESCECFDLEFQSGRKYKLVGGRFVGSVHSVGVGDPIPFTLSYLNARGSSRRWLWDYPKIKEFEGKVQMGSINLSSAGFHGAKNSSIITIGNVGIDRRYQGPGSHITTPDWSAKASFSGRAWQKDPGTYKCCGEKMEENAK